MLISAEFVLSVDNIPDIFFFGMADIPYLCVCGGGGRGWEGGVGGGKH